MDLRVLRYFVTTVKAGSITKASQDLFLTQPTLTRQIKELEDELGHELIKRSRHGITLTEKGSILYEKALELLDMAHKIKEEIKTDQELHGTITLTAAEAHAMHIIARAMTKFNQDHPFVRFNIVSAARDLAFARLTSGLCDFALVLTEPNPEFSFINLHQESRWGLIVEENSPLYNKSTIHAQDLRGLSLMVPQSSLESGVLDAWLGFSASKLRITAIHFLLNNALIMAQEGLGSILTIEKVVNLDPYKLKFIPLEPQVVSPAFFIWKKARPLSQAAEHFIPYVKQALKDYQEA